MFNPHPQYGDVKTMSTTVEVGGREYTIHLHKSSPSSTLCLHVGTLFGEPIAAFVEDNLEPIATFYKRRQAVKAAMAEHVGEAAAEEDLKAEILDMLGEAKMNVRKLVKTIVLQAKGDNSQLIADVFAFTKLDGEWLIGDHYENAFAGRFKDQLELASQIVLANRWLDFLSSGSDKEEPAKDSNPTQPDTSLSALPE